jgi:hypothetical protein
MPGDDFQASARFAVYSDDNPLDIDGDASGSIDGSWEAASNTETANFWKHLRAASLIAGDGDDDTQPTNSYGGNIGLRDGSLDIIGHVIIFGSVKGHIAKILDAQLDDGVPSTGLIQSDIDPALMDGNAVSSAGANYFDTQRYYMAFDI